MKRLRSGDDLNSFGEKGVFKDWGRRDDESSLSRSSSHRSFHYKPENGRRGVSSSYSPRHDRLDDERESSRLVRKRSDYNLDAYERRFNPDRYREGSDRGILSSSPHNGYGGDRIHRSESFSVPRREIPKGFRSERDRSRREDNVSSWRRFGMGKDVCDGTSGQNKVGSDEKGNMNFTPRMRESKSPACSKDSGSEQSKSTKLRDSGSEQSKSTKMKDSGNEESMITKIKDSRSEQSKTSKMKDSGSEQSKNSKMKDSVSEQSKSAKINDSRTQQLKSNKMTKTEDLLVENGSNSEMEEGELGSEPELEGRGRNRMLEEQVDEKMVEDKAKAVSSVEPCKDGVAREDLENGVKSSPELKSNKDNIIYEETLKFESQKSIKEVDGAAHSQKIPFQGLPVNEGAAETRAEVGGGNAERGPNEDHSLEKGENKDDPTEELIPVKEEHKEGNLINHAIEVVESGFTELDKGVSEGDDVPVMALPEPINGISTGFKDKGKSVVIVTSDSTDFEVGVEVPTESNHILDIEPDDVEGPSARGLDLFLNHPVKEPEKQLVSGLDKPKDEKLVLEPFDLSLSLPNVLLPIDSQNRGPAPGSPSYARSIQSIPSTFQTNSDGFTASMSFTGSQSIRHNPSCSLNNNSLDNFEHSVSSRPLFGGMDFSAAILQGQASTEQNQKEVPTYKKVLSNANGFFIRDPQLKVAEGSSLPPGLDRQLSLHRQQSINSKSSAGSRENRSEHSNDKKLVIRENEKVSSSISKSGGRNEEQFVIGGVDSVEPVLTMIVSEPVQVIAKKLDEMNEQAILILKNGVRDIIMNSGKRWQLSLFQKALNNRSEITLEMLLKANRPQLEIMVALKTGVTEFLQSNQNVSSSDMAEIYMNLKCRNLSCRNLLPVDDCDCKVCKQKNGFCGNCMCLVCSKYDLAANTCSWVGCDVCLHWCHTDCALRESYIRNGPSACGSHGLGEMQFHCVACDHPSEMFGFVKEVFQTFAQEWTGEKLSRELEYVRKIFSASGDVRGKQLHEVAVQMLSRLANKSDFREVQNYILNFLAEIGSINSDNPSVRSGMEVFNRNPEGNDKIGRPSQEPGWFKPLYSEKAPQLEKVSSFKSHQNNSGPAEPVLQRNASRLDAFDELDSIIRMKEAEAKMFQTRAEDARREAEGLKRIATAKGRKAEAEYASRISKLNLLEAEETRKQKIEELQVRERAYREYSNMKMRMEADIRALLSKMEAAKQNLAL